MPTTDTTTECPPLDALKRLLKARCDESQASPLCGHIENCPACQEQLERLAGTGPDLTADLRAEVAELATNNSALRGALKRAEHELTSTAIGPVPAGALATTAAVPDTPLSLSGTDERDPPDLSFLLPSKVPGNLGTFGPFEVRGVVGRGGMGVVLRGYDESLNREVAIKVIDPQLANNKQYRERFVREARAAAAVAHANLVAVYQVSEDAASGLPYIVMQLINGESLDQRLERTGKLIPKKVAWLGMQVAAGLDAAHKAGLTHRDIKPGNILLERVADPDAPPPVPTGSGSVPAAHEKFRVKLTDFGLAKAADDARLTRTGFVAGSPLYMAPEQAAGGPVDQRADLFSLGTLLYEAATGRAPFDAGTPLAVLRRLSDETQMPLNRVDPEVPKWLSDAVDKLLAKNPKDRFQTAREVAELFAHQLVQMGALSPLDIPADVCPAAYLKARGRKPICWKSVGNCVMPWAGGAVLGGLAVGLLWVLLGGAPGAPDAPAAEVGPAPRHVLKGETGAVWSLAFLSDDRLAAGLEDGTVRIWNHRTGLVARTLEPRQEGSVWAIDVSHDGKYLVFACDNSKVAFWDLHSLRAAGLEFPHPSSTRSAAFSPNSKFLATGDRASTVRVWDWENQIPVELTGHRGAIHALAFAPDGTRLASAGSDGSIKEWELKGIDWDQRKGPEPSMQMSDHRGPVYGLAFSPDGTKIASAGWDGTVRVWDAVNGTQLQKIDAHDGDAWSVSFGGGGKWVASAGSDAHVKVWDVATGKEVWGYRGPRGFHVVRFGPDGTTLAAGSRTGNVKVWDVK